MSTLSKQLRLADFIIGGAPRSGTTWLYNLLDRHPAVYMAKPVRPEPKFFLVDDIYAEGEQRYAEWFKAACPNQVAGEKSTNYLESREAARRIRHHIPGVKLLFILRDPVERAISNYLWSRMNGLEKLDIVEALRVETRREATLDDRQRFSRPYAYFSRGLYADMLSIYFELFPREQILCLRFEDIIDDCVELSRKVSRFLDIPFRPADVDDLGPANASAKAGTDIPDFVRKMLREAYAEPNLRLAKMLGDSFKLWKSRDG